MSCSDIYRWRCSAFLDRRTGFGNDATFRSSRKRQQFDSKRIGARKNLDRYILIQFYLRFNVFCRSASAEVGKVADLSLNAEGGLLDLDDLLGGPSSNMLSPSLELDPSVDSNVFEHEIIEFRRPIV